MRYPKIWRKITNGAAMFSGALAFIIGCLQVMESLLRYFFNAPTKWSLNVSEYLLIYLLFIGSAYAFQEHGHVAVDMVLNLVDKIDKTGKRIYRRILVSVGYLLAIVFVFCLLYGVWGMFTKAIEIGRVTTYIPTIPIWVLYAPMIIGMVMMTVTLVFMILDCISGSEEHI
ncbi:MAG: TRAP transporter small permease subunit [Peptococcaceae bacterium]|jgi:TRAP-type C4-dicarboxylate transport system permease small subunit|nr:TRAP transporter small permease subunit [Peptococcaceae bacterium]